MLFVSQASSATYLIVLVIQIYVRATRKQNLSGLRSLEVKTNHRVWSLNIALNFRFLTVCL